MSRVGAWGPARSRGRAGCELRPLGWRARSRLSQRRRWSSLGREGALSQGCSSGSAGASWASATTAASAARAFLRASRLRGPRGRCEAGLPEGSRSSRPGAVCPSAVPGPSSPGRAPPLPGGPHVLVSALKLRPPWCAWIFPGVARVAFVPRCLT